MPLIDMRSPPVDSVPGTWPRLPESSGVRSPTKRSGAVAPAAGLLLVAAMALGPARHRLAVGDLRGLGRDIELVLLLHLLQLDAHVQVAQAAHHRLVRGRVALDPQARILDLELVEHLEEALLVALLLGLDSDRVHRRREIERAQPYVVLVVRIVQH